MTVTVGSTTTSSGVGRIVGPVTQYVTDCHRDQVLQFLDGVGNSPFFVIMGAFAPHPPATPAPRDRNLFSNFVYRRRGYGETDLSDKPRWVRVPSAFVTVKNPDDKFHRNQLRSLQAVDRAIGAIIAKIRAQGKLNNTVFIFTSDNGYMWGEHGLSQKGQPYEECIRVPLVIVWPGIAPRRDGHLVAANLDIGPTLYEMAGVAKATDGRSLLSLLRNPRASWRTELLFEH